MKNIKCSVGIIDLSINNLFSIYKSCLEAGYKTEIIDIKKKNINYDIVILPGVGAFRSGINFIKRNYLDEKIYNYLEKPNALLYGICLGMQLLFNYSYEFVKSQGLNLIEGEVLKFKKIKNNNIINLGWSKFTIENKDYLKNFSKFRNKYFYYIHSYYAQPKKRENVFATSSYGNMDFCSIVKKNKIFGTQFHPEKSGITGIEFLRNLKKLKD
jgi:glutamine amidotransferase